MPELTLALQIAGVVLALVALGAVLLALRRLGRIDPGLVGGRLDGLEKGQERAERVLREEVARNREEAAGASRQLREELAQAQAEGRRTQAERLDKVDSTLRQLAVEVEGTLRQTTADFSKAAGDLRVTIVEAARMQADAGAEMRAAQNAWSLALQDRVQAQLEAVRKESAERLEAIRGTVENKLQSTLEARLGESFRMVSERLEQVYRGLGEMQALATGVGDLKRVLTNVRTRGTYAEIQLGALLEQVLAPEQFARNLATRPHSSERVEYAIRLPGRETTSQPVWLPVDAKFPQDAYQRLVQAYDAGDSPAIDAARAEIKSKVLKEAQTIRDKYVEPPHTTEIAIMFLPTEGLYAEVLRIPGLAEEVQSKHRVAVVGPTNLFAFLNSLQMGFRTLAIQKRSGEVWRLLGAIKTEFGKFGESLQVVRKKLEEACNKMDLAETRTRAVERKLREVESLPEDEAAAVLPESSGLPP